MVRLKGLEPTHISVREPKSRMSTNSITGAPQKATALTAVVFCAVGRQPLAMPVAKKALAMDKNKTPHYSR